MTLEGQSQSSSSSSLQLTETTAVPLSLNNSALGNLNERDQTRESQVLVNEMDASSSTSATTALAATASAVKSTSRRIIADISSSDMNEKGRRVEMENSEKTDEILAQLRGSAADQETVVKGIFSCHKRNSPQRMRLVKALLQDLTKQEKAQIKVCFHCLRFLLFS